MEISYAFSHRRQGGVTALMFIMIVMGLLVFSGMALDLALVQYRRQELDLAARTVAVAAAQQLNGKAGGIDNALAKGAEALADLRYRYGSRRLTWRDDMLSFGATPTGSWQSADAARAAAAGLLFVRADTGKLDAAVGSVTLFIIRMLHSSMQSVAVAATAVAGRSGIDVMPLAVCAMSGLAGAKRVNAGPPATEELVEYGFRRGVAYDLMQLNPDGVAPVSFVIHPTFAAGQAGGAGVAAGLSDAVVGPHVCTGQLGITTLQGGKVMAAQPFPLAALYRQLNSRFSQYENNLCTAETAVVDRNSRPYLRDGGVPWMAATPNESKVRRSPPLAASAAPLPTCRQRPPAPIPRRTGRCGPMPRRCRSANGRRVSMNQRPATRPLAPATGPACTHRARPLPRTIPAPSRTRARAGPISRRRRWRKRA